VNVYSKGELMPASIDNMRTVAHLCRTREPLPEPLAYWLATSLQSFLDQRSESLNDAFGLRNARGGVPWRMEASMRARDEALRRLASQHFRALTRSAQAARIQLLSARYEASSWRFDRMREVMPTAYEGTPHEFLWRAFKSGAAMPLGTRQLRTILGP
jgi:hypothetical protein